MEEEEEGRIGEKMKKEYRNIQEMGKESGTDEEEE